MQEQHNNDLETRITDLEQRVQKLETLLSKNHSNEKVKADTDTPQEKEVDLDFDLDFDLDIRAFVKRYVAGKNKKNGPQKFVFLLVYMSQGDITKDIEVKDIRKRWNKMIDKELLGTSFDGKNANRAKNNGWVRSRKYGSYHLTKNWKEVL